tara:strand:+ start:15883 stop:16470 length:588 start_codon:yes stop_codon:yes gene_type:complete
MDKELLQTVTLDHKKSLKLTHHQEQIVLGTLLGRGMIISPPGNRECYLRIRQSLREDINIIAYKATELKNFSRPKAFLEDKHSYCWNSISHQEWGRLHNFCYKNGSKNITMEWLDILTETALAMYYLDVGKIEKGLMELNVSRCNSKELICKFLNEVDCPCEVDKNKIRFNKVGTDSFARIISQSVPAYLLYRMS